MRVRNAIYRSLSMAGFPMRDHAGSEVPPGGASRKEGGETKTSREGRGQKAPGLKPGRG
jgi:hypothetical protein